MALKDGARGRDRGLGADRAVLKRNGEDAVDQLEMLEAHQSMVPKSGNRFPACARPVACFVVSLDASAGEGRSEKIMLQEYARVG
jgi:hypothetical protein